MQALPYLPLSPIIERIDSGCASNLMRVLIRLSAFIAWPIRLKWADRPSKFLRDAL